MGIILGIGWGHDSSVSLIKDDELICAIEEEKISRKKSENGFPKMALDLILKTYNITPQEVSIIAIPDRLYDSKSCTEIAFRMTKIKIFRIIEYFRRFFVYFFNLENSFSEKNKKCFEWWIRKFYKFKNAEIIYFDHHLCHASGALCTSAFKPDLIITCDGRGEQDSFNAYKISDSELPILFHSNDYNVSIGQLYSVVTNFLGFIPNRHEGKVMGLAARGKTSSLLQNMAKLYYYDINNNLARRPETNEYDLFLLPKFLQLKLSTSVNKIGFRYAKKSLWLKNWLEINSKNSSREEIAFAVQKTTEEVVLEEVSKIIEKNGGDQIKLALSGGVFANVVLNKKILELHSVDQLFIQPAMSDAGLSLGAAYLAMKSKNPKINFALKDTYLGPTDQIDFEDLIPYISKDFEINNFEDIYDQISNLLINNKIIGLFNGRNEFGPRALGNRSIIACANSNEMHDLLNERLKRNDFMPFAPSILQSLAPDYLEEYHENITAAEYMTLTFKVKDKIKDKIKAAVHIDGTARPHIVNFEKNKHFFLIIQSYYNKTGIGAVLNTSFNVHEEPIVSNYLSALLALKEGRIDFLNIGNYLLNSRIP